jgi:hypothetical protein
LNSATSPVGNFAPILFFEFLNGGVTTDLLINRIEPGIYSAAQCGPPETSGDQCTPPGSFVNFVNNPPPGPGAACGLQCQATATWVFSGIYDNAGTANDGTWVGNFTSQFPLGTTLEDVLAQLSTAGYVSNTYSATITLVPPGVIPEPGSMMLMGAGLLGLSLYARRRRAAK